MERQTRVQNPLSANASARRLALIYALAAGLWVTLSSSVLSHVFPHATPSQLSFIETVKGWLFIGVTAVVLYLLIRRRLAAFIASQEALRASERRYRQLVETAEEGVWVIDAEGKTTFVNSKMAESLGYSIPQMLGQPLERFMNADNLRILIADMDRTRQGIRQQSDVRFRRKDGSDLWTIVSSTPMYDERGAYAGLLATVTDITARKEAETRLAEAEAKYRALVEESLVGVYIVQDYRFVYVNPRFAEIFGYTQQEILEGRAVADLMTPESRQLVLENLRKRVEGELVSVHYTFTGLRKDGTRVDAEVLGSRTIYNGRPAVIGSLIDITERNRSEQALRRSERRFRQLVELAADALFLHDLNGKILDVNQQACETTGYTREQLLGMSVQDLECSQDRQRIPPMWQEVLNGPATIEGSARRKDGSCYPIEVRISVLDVEQPPLILALVRDITNRKQAEQKLRFTQFAVDRAADGVFWLDEEGRFVYINEAACRSLGYSREELLAMHVYDIDPDVPQEAWPEHLRELRQRRFTSFESRHRTKNGQLFPVEITSNALEFDGKEYICSFARDITERRRLETELRQSQKMEAVGRLAGGVAHDFNNLLAVIGGYSESLLRHVDPGSPLRMHAEEIGKAADRGASLTRQLLAFSRRQVVSPQIIDLNRVIQDLEEMLRRTLRKTIAIEFHLGEDLGKVKADPGQMEQVVVNLAINARDAMSQGGRLAICTENIEVGPAGRPSDCTLAPGQYVKLSVQDTGSGMDPEVQTRIFEPFFTTKDGQGTGLGLSIVYGIVQQAGGCIRVHSEPGHGTRFDVLLPRVGPAESAVSSAPSLESVS